MRHTIRAIWAPILLLFLCAGCGGDKAEAPFAPEQTVQALVDAGAFSEQLEQLDPALLFALPGAPEDYAGSVLYYSSGATAETAAVLTAPDAERAAQVEQALRDWLDAQIEAERSYRPAECEKLDHAILESRGDTVLLAVAADWEAAQAAVSEL